MLGHHVLQVAANTKGIQLVQELIAEHSLQVVQAYMKFIQANAGQLTKHAAVLAFMPLLCTICSDKRLMTYSLPGDFGAAVVDL